MKENKKNTIFSINLVDPNSKKKGGEVRLRVCLDRTYFVETEN